MNLSTITKAFKIYAPKYKTPSQKLLFFAIYIILLAQIPIVLNKYYFNTQTSNGIQNSNFRLNLPQIDSKSLILFKTSYEKKIEELEQECLNKPNFEHCYTYDFISIKQLLESLTTEEKIKQLLAPAYSYEIMQNSNISKSQFGAYVIIRSKNYKSSSQINTDIKNQFLKNQEIPPLIGIDAEGGVIQRFSWHKFKHLSELTMFTEKQLCSEIKDDINVIKSSGFNWSLAPVIDLPYNNQDWIANRAISGNKKTITQTAANYINCMNSQNILTTLKHFPGHGDSINDSHYKTPIINHSKEQWELNEGSVYKNLINNNSAPTIMTGHLKYPIIDGIISSISPHWQNQVLRNELNFDGLIITDDIHMLNSATEESCYEQTWQAIKTGSNLVIFVEHTKCSGQKMTEFLVDKYNSTKEDKDIINKRISKTIKFKRDWFNKH